MRWIGRLMVSLSHWLPLLPFLTRYPPVIRSVLLLLDSDWGWKMWLWLIVVGWDQSNAGMAHRAAPSSTSSYSAPRCNHEPHLVEQWSLAHARQHRELFWIWVRFLFKFMHSGPRQTQLWSIKRGNKRTGKAEWQIFFSHCWLSDKRWRWWWWWYR